MHVKIKKSSLKSKGESLSKPSSSPLSIFYHMCSQCLASSPASESHLLPKLNDEGSYSINRIELFGCYNNYHVVVSPMI